MHFKPFALLNMCTLHHIDFVTYNTFFRKKDLFSIVLVSCFLTNKFPNCNDNLNLWVYFLFLPSFTNNYLNFKKMFQIIIFLFITISWILKSSVTLKHNIGMSGWQFGWSAFGGSTGKNVNGHYVQNYCLSFPSFIFLRILLFS